MPFRYLSWINIAMQAILSFRHGTTTIFGMFPLAAGLHFNVFFTVSREHDNQVDS